MRHMAFGTDEQVDHEAEVAAQAAIESKVGPVEEAPVETTQEQPAVVDAPEEQPTVTVSLAPDSDVSSICVSGYAIDFENAESVPDVPQWVADQLDPETDGVEVAV